MPVNKLIDRAINKIITLLIVFLLITGCSQKPEIKFSSEWSDDVSAMWNRADNTLVYYHLKTDKNIKSGDQKTFVLLVKGKIPLGLMSITAIGISDNKREKAYIEPVLLEKYDPKANLRAIKIHYLIRGEIHGERDAVLMALRIRETGKNIEPGQYYISLQKDGVEIAGSNLQIAE